MTTQIAALQLRRGTASLWTSTNPILADGEFGKESDTGKVKLGDGVTHWADLPYVLPVDLSSYALVSALTAEASRAQTAEALRAPLASPALTGNPQGPTPAAADSSTSLATTAYVKAQTKFAVFTRPGALVTEVGAARLPFPKAAQLSSAIVSVGTAPTGAALIVDVLKNGASIWGTNPGNRPSVPAGSNVSNVAVPDILAMAAGDYLQVQIVQVGSTVAGADLTASVGYN